MDFIAEHSKLIISIVSSLIGLGIFSVSMYYSLKAKASANWHTIEGVVLNSEVVKEKSGSGSESSVLYRADVCYTYEILNEKFVSSKISFMPKFSTTSSSSAYKKTINYPSGSKVCVYYNPTNPEEAVLEPGVKTEHILLLAITGIAFVAGIIFTYSCLTTTT